MCNDSEEHQIMFIAFNAIYAEIVMQKSFFRECSQMLPILTLISLQIEDEMKWK